MQKTEISLDIYQNIPTDRNQYPVEFIERNQCLFLEKKDDIIIAKMFLVVNKILSKFDISGQIK